MNYLYWILFISFIYFIITKKEKSILLIFVLGGFYLYYESILPNNFFELPKKKYQDEFDFPRLDKLINLYYKANNEDSLIYENEINRKIKNIYFAFPKHQHKSLNNFFNRKYGFKINN